MIQRTLGEIAAMIGQASMDSRYAHTTIQGVSIDTRTIVPGNLFVPIRGPHFNGHDFVRNAIAQGAAASFWCSDEPNPPEHVPLLFVEDTLEAMQQLARAYRSQLRVKVIGITGSNGKTSTKDMLASILATTYRTEKTNGNLNNHLGVPLTLLRLKEETEMAVVEMGMSALGEIALLASIAQPDAAIITSVSEVHLGDLKTRERIVEAKLEIVSSLKENGLFVYNADNAMLTDRLQSIEPPCQAVSFGQSAAHGLSPDWIRIGEDGVTFRISDRACPELSMDVLGKHQVINALGAIAVARYFGVEYDEIRNGLQQVSMTGMRNERIIMGSNTLINDAYKSNPTSVRAALDTLYALPGHKRKIVVLGDMVELGDEAETFHREIGAELDPTQIDCVFTLGPMAAHIAEVARKRFASDRVIACLDKRELAARLQETIREDCIVLIKGSRGLHLEDVVEALRKEAHAG